MSDPLRVPPIYETLPEDGEDERLALPPVHFTLYPLDTPEPYPDLLDIESELLAAWLESLEIHPDPRNHKCAFWHSPRDFELRLKTAPDSRLLWLKEGAGTARVGRDGTPFPFRSGDALLVPPGLEHDFVADAGSPVTFLSVHFHITILGGLNPLELLGFPRHLSGVPSARAADRMAREAATRAPGWKLAVASELSAIVLFLIRHRGSEFSPGEDRKLGRHMLQILPALRTIEQRLGDPALGVDALADSAGVSQVYLRRLFREVVGLSPNAFVQRRRIEHSCLMLREYDQTIGAIASECGFTHLPYYYRLFKRWTGTTPSRYRNG